MGRFSMDLSLPVKTDTRLLESRYRRRIELQPPPPPQLVLRRARFEEEEAKRAWLARLDQAPSSWRQARLPPVG